MRTSTAGINLIKSYEGCRLNAYADTEDVPTIGYGHTHGVNMGERITQEQADQYLTEDLKEFEDYINKYDIASLTQHQFDALVSFTYDLGLANLHHSRLLTALNDGDFSVAANCFLDYDHAGGAQLPGLTLRRQAERALFLTPDPEVKKNTLWGDILKQWQWFTGSKPA